MIEYNVQGARIPKMYRSSKEQAKILLDWYEANEIEIKNPDILVLKNWIDPTIDSKIKSIVHIGKKDVYDITVNSDHSFFGNGMAMHNCNLPNEATKELVSQIYLTAWESGCKGFTVYRDGCRDGVLITGNAEKKESFEEKSAPKRPDHLDCDIHQVKIKGEAWTIFIGKYEGKPYEIFGGLSKYVSISKKYTTGKLVKGPKKKGSTKSIYNIHIGDEESPIVISDIVKTFENPTEGEFTRMISLALRHGAPVQYIVEQLQKDEESDMYSFSKVIARVLKTYIVDGIVTKEVCPNCGGSIVYIEGCKQCGNQCGYSKC